MAKGYDIFEDIEKGEDVDESSVADIQTARDQWARYEHVKARGHDAYCRVAKHCEEMYRGAGGQWSEGDREFMEEQGLPTIEFNGIKPAVDSVAGYQINSRLEMAAVPVGGESDSNTAEIMSKVIKQIMTLNDYQRLKTSVFFDGEIQGRGFFDLRMDYSNSVMGRLKISVPDPMDVIPDPDAKSYDPDDWADVHVLRWMTIAEIGQIFGDKVAKRVKLEAKGEQNLDFGEGDSSARRNRFGTSNSYFSFESEFVDDDSTRRYRVIDRQYFVRELCLCAVFNENDVRVVEGLPAEKLAELVQAGATLTRRVMRRIRWTVTTMSTVLFNEYSLYDHFTIVPFFFNFRRGLTMGMVENAIGPQVALNKAVVQFLHTINSASNSGWEVEQGSITNMTMEEFEATGARNGRVVEYAKGATPPKKTLPNPVPQGISEMISLSKGALTDSTIPEVARGTGGEGIEVSGIALQTRQFAAQQQLALPLDNLARTQQMVGRRIISIIQRFYTHPMVMRITEQDAISGANYEEIALNQPAGDGTTFNDLSAGDYDIALNEQPTTVTFGQSQFEQAMELIGAGVPLPPEVPVKYSMLSDKGEIMARMAAQGQQQPPADPTLEAKAALLRAQAEQVQAATVKTGVETMFTAAQTSQVIIGAPEASPLSDKLLGSAGFVDRDSGPIVPAYQGGAMSAAAAEVGPGVQPSIGSFNQTTAQPQPGANPESPTNGMNGGIETLRADSVR